MALEFVRVTEAAAIAAASWIGKGDKNAADKAAVDEMRDRFNQIDFKGRVVIGEGTKDEAPELFEGELLGTGKGSEMDIAVDPLEGTTNTAFGYPNAMSVIVAGAAGSLMPMPKGKFYIEKIAVGPQAAKVIDLEAPVKVNINKVSKALGKSPQEVTVVVLERDRHKALINDLRKAGARVRLINAGDLAPGIATCFPDSGIDMVMGTGGTPEAVLAAAAIKIMGGQIFARFPEEKKIFDANDLAKGNQLTFTATGIIEGPLLKGITISDHIITTHSVVMRLASKTIRYITTHHHAKSQ
ncbi:MAG: class II fructose-bisphosphatase [Patescibacteria group bacterium]